MINRLYVFGDSLSDTGAVFRATGGSYPPNPPYFQGRYSNGRVWVEYLGDRLGISSNQIYNFAWGGATTGNQVGNLVPSLQSQVQSFLQTRPQLQSSDLFILWAGANDYLQGANQAGPPIANVTAALLALMEAGGQQFLVANLPDLGQLPATRSSASASTLTTLTQSHNQELRRALKQLGQKHAGLQLATLDAHRLYREAVTNPAGVGLTNVLSACVAATYICDNPDQFLFWDGIHPTRAAHQLLAKAAIAALESEGMVSSKSPLAL